MTSAAVRSLGKAFPMVENCRGGWVRRSALACQGTEPVSLALGKVLDAGGSPVHFPLVSWVAVARVETAPAGGPTRVARGTAGTQVLPHIYHHLDALVRTMVDMERRLKLGWTGVAFAQEGTSKYFLGLGLGTVGILGRDNEP